MRSTITKFKAACLGSCFLLTAGCGSDGLVFNGQQQVEQFPIRKIPIKHYNLPVETIDQRSGSASVEWSALPTDPAAFSLQGFPGHDWWAMNMFGACSDNPTCRTPNEIPDWPFTHDTYKTPGPGWPNANVSTLVQPANVYIAAWVLSFQNQWFIRDADGSALPPQSPGAPARVYDSLSFMSMAISVHEVGVGGGFTPALSGSPPTSPQQEVGSPGTVGANNAPRIAVPVNNVVSYGYNGNGAPAGMLAAGWRERPAENISIETNLSSLPASNVLISMVGVPVPDYFGGGGPINAGGGVYMQRYSNNWQQTTAGTSSAININDGVTYSYYLAVIANHIIGYGLGLIDSTFALPGVIDTEEDIMNISVIFDMTAFIAAGKKFQFVPEDLLRMQDTVNGTFMNPGSGSTLPGAERD